MTPFFSRLQALPAAGRLAVVGKAWAHRFGSLAPRERTLLILAAAGVLLFAVDRLALQPIWSDWQRSRLSLQDAQARLAQLDLQVAAHTSRQAQHHAQLQAEWRALQARAQPPGLHTVAPGAAGPAGPAGGGGQGDLVSVQGMQPLLERLLAAHPGLRVRALTSLGPTDLDQGHPAATPTASPAASTAGKPATDGAAPHVYRQGVELTLEGGWGDLVAWLQALEDAPLKVLWGGLKLEVARHPQLQMTVKLYTLSLDAGWMEIGR